jgi:asparagine synthase (glutamine-hydrolysing)
MCGIAGEIRRDPSAAGDIAAQLGCLRHRGPDAEGAFERPHASIGQTRLSIIDLETGDPPIANEDGTVGVVLNGEIYNFRELRSALRGRGHTFRSEGDTEVIVHLAEECEPRELAAALDGMFTFAVWDDRRRRLVIARDRFGKKPLYYWYDGRRLVFGSEIKAVVANSHVPRRLRAESLPDYLTFGYVPTPHTFFDGIVSLPPGHVLTVGTDCQPRVEPYWSPSYPGASSAAPVTASSAAIRDGLRARLRAAVERRLIADVPLGAFLSGGIDSSAVVALMAQATDRRVATFTIGFEDKDGFDERPYARAVAQKYGTDHTEFVVHPNAAELIERLVWHYDQPFGDSSSLPTFMLSELTRQHVTVALCGDGGDELFAGYERLAAARWLARYERVPQPIRSGVRQSAQLLPRDRGRLGRVRRALLRSDLSAPMGLLAWVSYVPEEWKRRLTSSPARVGIDAYQRIWSESSGADALDRVLDLNIRTYLLDDLLPKVDRMSMAHGLEVRSPFLDRDLAEYAFRLPAGAHVRGPSLKRALKSAVADLLPDEILNRKKHGFGIPLDRWFRTDLATYVSGSLCSHESRVSHYLDGDAVRTLVDDHRNMRGNHGHALWTLLTLEVFLRQQGW